MANRYNDQDYPRYYDRGDRGDDRSEQRGRAPRGARREPEDINRERQGYYGMSYDREGENRSQDSSSGDFGRGNRSDREDYTLYGYDRESRQGAREQERRHDERGENRQSNQHSSGRQPDYRERDNSGGRRNFYGQGGGQIGSERGYTDANRGGGEDEGRGWWDKTSDQVSSWFGDEDAQRRLQSDERESNYGTHRGRGPKNYRRTDSRIEEDLNDRLTVYAYLDASDIEVSVKDGEATLTGMVENRYAKRMAEDIADDTAGITHVENRLRVRQQQNRHQSESSINVSVGDTGAMTGGSASGGETGASLAASGGASPTATLTGDQSAATQGMNASALNIEDDDSFDERGVDRLSNPKTD